MHLTLTYSGDKAKVLRELRTEPEPQQGIKQHNPTDQNVEVRRAVTTALADHIERFAQDAGQVTASIHINANYLAALSHEGQELERPAT